jgi:hypothetical protein
MVYCDRCERWLPRIRVLNQHKEDSDTHWPCHDVASTSRASKGGKSTINEVVNTIYSINLIAYSTSTSPKSNTWRPSIGVAAHDRVSNSTAAIITWASNERLMPSYTVDLRVQSWPAITLQTELRSPRLRKVLCDFDEVRDHAEDHHACREMRSVTLSASSRHHRTNETSERQYFDDYEELQEHDRCVRTRCIDSVTT